ncbi:hypothetical protein IVB69_03395 [Flavobacterium sp. J49]|uniref:hypothetical protein n=1 Tax=Flavobacterium sp. J49 TaxID=2718534 RepID=UPI0015933071|nr:hypothetical protein [Flavobacterium sp. J49]MBF6640515.1 hypothetical protein [Flavobacterium sp. J49]NIC01762.1 hypothetical protein [Flavobacterium sp. J49]
MKNFAIKLVWFTTIYVFVFAGLCQTNVTFQAIMSLYILGLFLILFMVYIVLTDSYKTSKRFKDWYGDHTVEH